MTQNLTAASRRFFCALSLNQQSRNASFLSWLFFSYLLIISSTLLALAAEKARPGWLAIREIRSRVKSSSSSGEPTTSTSPMILASPKLSDSPFSEMFEWNRFQIVTIDWGPQKVKPTWVADLTASSALDSVTHSYYSATKSALNLRQARQSLNLGKNIQTERPLLPSIVRYHPAVIRLHFKPIRQFHSPGRFLSFTDLGTGSSKWAKMPIPACRRRLRCSVMSSFQLGNIQ
jgi:hypothetical protein